MTAFISTAYSRDLGDELRHLREGCTQLNGYKFAAKLGWDSSKVSNIERGKARATEIDLIQYLTACDKDIDFIEEFSGRYRNAFDPYIVQVPDNLRTLAMAESAAKKITSYDVLAVPGLVQSPEYAESLFVEAGVECQKTIAKGIELRVARQAILKRLNRPEVRFYVHELALQLRVGDVRVMDEQYMRMLFNTHELRIVPMSAGAGVARQSPRVLFEFEKALPVSYCEHAVAKVFAQDSDAINQSREFFNWLEERALDEEQSRSMLAEYVSRLREDPHDPGADLA